MNQHFSYNHHHLLLPLIAGSNNAPLTACHLFLTLFLATIMLTSVEAEDVPELVKSTHRPKRYGTTFGSGKLSLVSLSPTI